MVSGQVDPARLSGDALRRWYLRSPVEIAQERLSASERAHYRFFGGEAAVRPPMFAMRPADEAHGAPMLWTASSANRWRGQRDVSAGFQASSRGNTTAPPTATDRDDCIGCHGRLRPPTIPFPWTWGRSRRDNPNSTPPKPPERDRKQCELQYEFDTDICNGQASEEAKAVCHGSASNRYAHCRKTGELDTPHLSTFRSSPRR